MQHADPILLTPAQQAVAAFLGDPRSHGGAAVERIDTHAAMVFLAGDRAFKLKRAVRYPFLDFSTLERRHAACLAEVALNRRTAPTLYQGVERVVRLADGGLSLGGDGEVVDWVVAMRRFPDDALFDRMALRGALTPELMRELAGAIAAFHRTADVSRDAGGADAIAGVVAENLEELRAAPGLFPPDAVARLAELSRRALETVGPLLEQRRWNGFVRHCHGDLHLRNIVLLDGRPTLFDGIEFNPAFAVIDTAYDLAFLLMDLEHRGLRPLGNAALNRYLEDTGDYGGLAALPLFLSARAAVRAKIAALPAGGSAEAAREAQAYLDLAIAVLERPAVRMVAVGGLSGTGKSLLARGLAPRLGPVPGAVVLRSDAVRKRLFGVAETDRLPADAYTPAVTERVYALLGEQAAAVLAAGHAVVVDAVCARPEERAAMAAAAAGAGVRFAGFWLEAPLATRIARVTDRRNDASDATAAVAERQESYDPGPLRWMRVEAGRDAADVLAEIVGTLA